ncbi:STAS domain-containing protein [Actinoplanes sp. NEAU-A12]|uniref:Anti-sigma factor antagonist n=1 Tax=Actinoplanes sandaracinus TaxID=3045177 RepID=A0ABT6WG85_9ACTN|nr:STAS domain-containing protein [Actinoplanes sandaracinus]MDI6098743.1 STAS domain-containing protein [Actinoplanes sandaracinus]
MGPLSVSHDQEALCLALSGDIDFVNSAPITQAIREAVIQSQPTLVRVDVAEVSFLDSSGLGVLVAALRVATDCGAVFRVERPNANVYGQLEIAGLLEIFGLADSDGGRSVAGR